MKLLNTLNIPFTLTEILKHGDLLNTNILSIFLTSRVVMVTSAFLNTPMLVKLNVSTSSFLTKYGNGLNTMVLSLLSTLSLLLMLTKSLFTIVTLLMLSSRKDLKREVSELNTTLSFSKFTKMAKRLPSLTPRLVKNLLEITIIYILSSPQRDKNS